MFAPFDRLGRPGDPSYIAGTGGDGQTQQGNQQGQGTNNGSYVPYAGVYGDFYDYALTTLDRSYVPISVKDYVRDYFSSLDPNQLTRPAATARHPEDPWTHPPPRPGLPRPLPSRTASPPRRSPSAPATIEAEVGKVIVGQRELVRHTLVGLLANGHVLLEGVPGLGKTMLVRTLADVIDCTFNRVQFTPDLMPADITGTNILIEEGGTRVFRFQPGPIFANLVLADEINRATPKTQSSLLEAMQEHQVTVARNRYPLDPPFFVLATQNPLEMEGTYPLPEAQLDRFLLKVMVPFPSEEDLIAILDRTTGADAPQATRRHDGRRDRRDAAARARGADRPAHHGLRRLGARRRPTRTTAAPRRSCASTSATAARRAAPRRWSTAGKILALMDGRFNVSVDDVRAAALPALRHRVILNFEGEAEGISTEAVVRSILDEVAPPSVE